MPGPGFPLYLAGSRMREVYPHLPLFEQQGIGIALLSYMGRLYVGIGADWNLGELLRDIAADRSRARRAGRLGESPLRPTRGGPGAEPAPEGRPAAGQMTDPS